MYSISPPTAANSVPYANPTDSLLVESLARELVGLQNIADDLCVDLRSGKKVAADIIPALADVYAMNRTLAAITKHLFPEPDDD
jgi:hypothetical protein